MRRNFTVDQEFTVLFNTVREKHVGKKLKKENLEKIFKEELGFKLDQDYLKFLVKNNIITVFQKGKRNCYQFTYHPIYIEKLVNWYKDIQNFRKERREKYAQKQIAEQVCEVSVIDPIDEAIALLKSYGYKILKPVNTWEEV